MATFSTYFLFIWYLLALNFQVKALPNVKDLILSWDIPKGNCISVKFDQCPLIYFPIMNDMQAMVQTLENKILEKQNKTTTAMQQAFESQLQDNNKTTSAMFEALQSQLQDHNTKTEAMQQALESHLQDNTKTTSAMFEALESQQAKIQDQNKEKFGKMEDMLTELLNKISPPTTTTISPPSINCADLLKIGHRTSGVYEIFPVNIHKAVSVYCDQTTDGGGYTVIQQRRPTVQPRENFTRGWRDYQNGFGDAEGEFWLGLENIHALTKGGKMELRVDLEDYDGETGYASYKEFEVGDLQENYKLSVGGFSGTAGDSLDYHNGVSFSTHDKDNDSWSENCAELYKSGWWFSSCFNSDLNGPPNVGKVDWSDGGIFWQSWKQYYSFKKASMKIRPNL